MDDRGKQPSEGLAQNPRRVENGGLTGDHQTQSRSRGKGDGRPLLSAGATQHGGDGDGDGLPLLLPLLGNVTVARHRAAAAARSSLRAPQSPQSPQSPHRRGWLVAGDCCCLLLRPCPSRAALAPPSTSPAWLNTTHHSPLPTHSPHRIISAARLSAARPAMSTYKMRA
ncbi:hypothetical protein K505DRAFT_416430 [Melanomma pulvis-pyrius CBS 109.77]|uniref:Uncharacterized protein n=1 Tax=Melanomma pulvis-pyrius CBS 109.77 TaxID=1314802 RepID=A0A6A6XGJ7_9PLEO|nr:hypothetical protein K505DRAFT_416430 [Melanomma pulvis-pyrius CBS 109.77]